MPKVSIITSIFNSSFFLEGFLKDAMGQSIFFDCEFLLLDCNDDNADYELILPFLGWSPFKYFKLGKCSVYEAWNKGIELSNSAILTNWNTDDRRERTSLERQFNFLFENPATDVCYGPTYVSAVPNESFADHVPQMVYPALEGTIENQMTHNSPHCLPMWRKSIHDKFGLFNTDYFSAADYDMWFRVLKGGGTLSKMEEPIGIYFQNPKGISTNCQTLEKAYNEVMAIREKYS